ncbi:hypothetical protein LP52_22215 [Streptomonospora alba]|uniref:Uncharacterized protein n=1 Tax=Streptomonospora alba TaxID=183763 RepID=A0A0C2FCU1_9ACTN|nr:hypothetical protein LP52_22215 [Streptomonospora alba]
MTFAWAELDDLVGGLPRSAYEHAAFWKGVRPGWPGFTAVNVEVNRSVTFVRRSADAVTARRPRSASTAPRQPAGAVAADLVLVGCVRTKLDRAAPAQDLYTSPLFVKQRAYAEATGAPWFVLSAKHGLVPPTTVLEPYELHLSKAPRSYREGWGTMVTERLTDVAGPLAGKVVEVHAASAYADAIRDRLVDERADVREPLRGLPLGKRLAWYNRSDAAQATATAAGPAPETASLVERLGSCTSTITPAEFLARGGAGLRLPGLYSWWVDRDGAADLSAGLGLPVEPGLIYAGLAGATRPRSGRRSKNTLWARIRGMHLGGRHAFSTFRLSLGSVLASARDESEIDEERLTAWMHGHLRLVAITVEDPDTLDGLETAVLARLDPPLNLDKMPRSPVREQLTRLRRAYGRGSR